MESKLILSKIIDRHNKYKPATAYLQKEVEDELTKLSIELGMTKEEIRSIWVSQFRFVRDATSVCKKPTDEDFTLDTYRSIRLPYFGKFEAKKSFIKNHKDDNIN